MIMTKNIGMLLLAIYLIVVGIVTLTGVSVGMITGVLALLARNSDPDRALTPAG
jgi:hypothetical protein